MVQATTFLLTITSLACLAVSACPVAPSTDHVPSPLPASGGIDRIVDIECPQDGVADVSRSRRSEWDRVIRRIARNHFGSMKLQRIRQEGIDKLGLITDPGAFVSMVNVLEDEQDDVRLAMLDQFDASGEPGDAALAWVAILDEDPAIRHEAAMRITTPAPDRVLHVLDSALRRPNHQHVNNAGILAGHLDALETIPLLMFNQVTADPIERRGDLAWISIGTTTSYVSDLIPVVGGNSAAFQPVVSTITEGVVMRVSDAVAFNYRMDLHNSLVSLTSHDWGSPTNDLGFDMKRWWAWYNNEYVPYKRAQAGLPADARTPGNS